MELEEKRKLVDYLSGFVLDARNQRMENVLDRRTRHLTIVLEDIYQPHNASAVIRSCDCFGLQDLYIIENKNEYNLNPEVDMGSSNWVDLKKYKAKENNTVDCIKDLKAKGYKIAAATPHNPDRSLQEIDITEKTAVLLGTELTGLTEEALELADYRFRIPMEGFTESFNISVSAALCLFHLRYKLNASEVNWQLQESERLEIKLRWLKKAVTRNREIPEAIRIKLDHVGN